MKLLGCLHVHLEGLGYVFECLYTQEGAVKVNWGSSAPDASIQAAIDAFDWEGSP